MDELAGLARLQLAEDEASALAPQLGEILGYIQTLSDAPVEGVPEFRSARRSESGLRADETGPMLRSELALAGVPERRGEFVAVPKFKD